MYMNKLTRYIVYVCINSQDFRILKVFFSLWADHSVWKERLELQGMKQLEPSQRYSDLLRDILMLSKIFRRYLEDIPKISRRYSDALEDIPKISRRYSLTITCIQDKSQKVRSLHLTHLTFLVHSDQCPLMRSSILTQRDRATSSHSMFSLPILPGQLFSY